jgi:hypothetical protein
LPLSCQTRRRASSLGERPDGRSPEEVEVADRVGLDVFGIGEHHRAEFLDSAPAIILAAAAARTSQIRLTSAVTVLSAADPVRVFQEFATLDSSPRVAPNWSSDEDRSAKPFRCLAWTRAPTTSSSPRSSICLLKLGEATHPNWKGRFRPRLPAKASIRVPISRACRSGSASAARRNPSPAPARSACR